MSGQHTQGPRITVNMTVDGKTFPQEIVVNMEGLAAAIVDRAFAFTRANDRGDAASDAYDEAETDEERAAAAQASDAADNDYNAEKASLFMLCRMLASAREKVAEEQARAAIAKATGSAS